jgi:hypothetical protein
MLERLPGIEVDRDVCQEDWGVVIFVRSRGGRFWVGLSWYDEATWLAHFHHDDLAWLQRLRPSGRRALQQLVRDTRTMLASDPNAAIIR